MISEELLQKIEMRKRIKKWINTPDINYNRTREVNNILKSNNVLKYRTYEKHSVMSRIRLLRREYLKWSALYNYEKMHAITQEILILRKPIQ